MALDLVELAKKKAAYQAVDEFVRDGMIVGVGSGSTVIYAVQRLAQVVHEYKYNIVCVPTSFQSQQLIIEAALNLSDLSRYPSLDVAIDGADEVDEELNLIKGGGGCQTQEKIVAANSKKLVIICDYRKRSKNLGEKWKTGVPIEVIPFAYVPLIKKITEEFKGKPVLRMAVKKAGPVVTDNGNLILDVDFGVIPLQSVKDLHTRLKALPGVVETGLFVGMTNKVFFGNQDGTVSEVTPATPKL
eukprot:TRINITY_DN17423_c0_g1_i1.p1 TRINITY_DN17423_c0_g1~~TRINITY_DN17423_c0_g1_i1.p1  ORF type:complete len:244 (+),score=70.92 TRINITY_DN17423_c0_g1_i1:884-1615(+)